MHFYMNIIPFFIPLFALLVQCAPLNHQSSSDEMNQSTKNLTASLSLKVDENDMTIALTNTSNHSIVVDRKFEFFISFKFYNLQGKEYVKPDPDNPHPSGSPLLTYIDKGKIPENKEPFKDRFVTLEPGKTVSKMIKDGDLIEYYSMATSFPNHDISIGKEAYICPNINNIGKIKVEYSYFSFDLRILYIISNRNHYKVPDNYFRGDISTEWNRFKHQKKIG